VARSTLQKLLEQMRRAPQNVRFTDACRLADSFFGPPRQKGSSHRVYSMPWRGDPRVNLQEGAGGKAKAYQVRQLVQAIDRLLKQNVGTAPIRPTEAESDQGPEGE
jgi:hypothetical protein